MFSVRSRSQARGRECVRLAASASGRGTASRNSTAIRRIAVALRHTAYPSPANSFRCRSDKIGNDSPFSENLKMVLPPLGYKTGCVVANGLISYRSGLCRLRPKHRRHGQWDGRRATSGFIAAGRIAGTRRADGRESTQCQVVAPERDRRCRFANKLSNSRMSACAGTACYLPARLM